MKMMRSTRMTSTSGVTLISARVPSSSSSPYLKAIALHEISLGQIQKLECEVFHLATRLAKLLEKVVVAEQRGDRGEQSCGGVDERFADAGSNGDDRRGSAHGDPAKGSHDSPDGPEKSDEG